MGEALKLSFKNKIFILLFSLLLSTLLSSTCLANIIEESESTEIEKPKIERHFIFETLPSDLEEITFASGIIFSGECLDSEEIENDQTAEQCNRKERRRLIGAALGPAGFDNDPKHQCEHRQHHKGRQHSPNDAECGALISTRNVSLDKILCYINVGRFH